MAMEGVTDLRITGDILVVGAEAGRGAVPWRMEPPLERESAIREAFLLTPCGLMRVEREGKICAVAAANSASLYGVLVLVCSFTCG